MFTPWFSENKSKVEKKIDIGSRVVKLILSLTSFYGNIKTHKIET